MQSVRGRPGGLGGWGGRKWPAASLGTCPDVWHAFKRVSGTPLASWDYTCSRGAKRRNKCQHARPSVVVKWSAVESCRRALALCFEFGWLVVCPPQWPESMCTLAKYRNVLFANSSSKMAAHWLALSPSSKKLLVWHFSGSLHVLPPPNQPYVRTSVLIMAKLQHYYRCAKTGARKVRDQSDSWFCFYWSSAF